MSAQVAIEDSNIALLGSELHKKVRLAAAESAEEWKGCGQKEGIENWRIENFKVARWPKDQYGSFYSGDSYIILHTYKDASKPEQKKLLYNVHFWLGEHTTQDEAGTAAYKTVELDDLLGDLPVQFREVQGSESDSFLKLFNPGMKILQGGVDSGFTHVKPEEYKPRLMHIKGKKVVRVQEVPLALSSLNEGDVFVLDNGLELIQWNGPEAAISEKRKGQEVLQNIREERLGKARVEVLDGGEEHPTFWKMLGGKGKIHSAAEGGDDSKVSTVYTKRLMQVSDESGRLQMTEVATGSFSRSDLNSDDVFIIDTEQAVFVYIGRGASKQEREQAFKVANEYLVKYERSFTTPVIRVVEGSSNPQFEGAFAGKFKPVAKRQ